MSLYNMLNGNHPLTAQLLGVLGFTNETAQQIPRYRDIFLFDDCIKILTRTGGGNREAYVEQNEWLASLPGYVRDYDDPFDSTFAWWVFDLPEKQKEALIGASGMIKEMAPHLQPSDLKEITDRNIAALDNSKQ